MFLTLRNEKTLKKMRSKTLKNNIFFILGRNLIIRSFEIPHSIWKLHKDFKSVFVFKFRQKTKKFTPKWQKPLFEKRVQRRGGSVETKHNTDGPSVWGSRDINVSSLMEYSSQKLSSQSGIYLCSVKKNF